MYMDIYSDVMLQVYVQQTKITSTGDVGPRLPILDTPLGSISYS